MNLFSEDSDAGWAQDQTSDIVNPHQPRATRMRPRSLQEVVGQHDIVGEGKMLRRMIESGVIGSLMFYGPPSSGKTTLVHVIARQINAQHMVIDAALYRI